MRLIERLVVTAAFGIFLAPSFLLHADEAVAPPAGGENKAADSSSSDPANARPASFMPMRSMAAASPLMGGRDIGVPRAELFLGYSYLRAVPTMAVGNRLVWLNGGSAAAAFNLNHYLSLVADFGAYTNSQARFTGGYTSTVNVDNSNVAVFSYLGGPRISFRQFGRLTPFAQVLFGGVHANEVRLSDCTFSCRFLPAQSSFAFAAGGGLDYRFHRHFAFRIIQAEYLMTRFADYNTGNSLTQNDMRLSSGIVFRFGGGAARVLPPPSPLEYSCSVRPTGVYPGEPIAASGTAVNLNPAKPPVYTWQVDGGKVTGNSEVATIDTTGAAIGSYTLKGHVSQGDKPDENADCTAPYAVKAYDPPTVSCTANPVAVTSGDPSTITAVGVSPQSRALTYSYSATSGTVSGTGTTASLSTVGDAAGTVAVTCTVVDDKGQTASAQTSVLVAVPVAAPVPHTSDLCSIHFERDLARPARVDNEAKACLDEIALSLNNNPDAKLALVGNASSEEKAGNKLAAERAVNTKAYLVKEKGIDPSRISVYTRAQDGKAVSSTLIPAGATLDSSGDTAVDENAKANPVRGKKK